MSYARLPLALSVAAVLALAGGCARTSTDATAAPGPSLPAAATAQVNVARLPLAFERNQGQTDASVQYFARGAGYAMFLTPTQVVFNLAARAPKDAGARDTGQSTRNAVLRMALHGADPGARAEGLQPQAGTSHYLTGNDPQRWTRDVAHVGQVRYRGVYDGVDVVYYGNQNELEYDFVVAPGKDPAQIALAFEGARDARIDADGNLLLDTDVGTLTQRRPVAYQDIDGERVPVPASYRRVGDLLALEVGDYDRSHALVIDPVLSYSSYLGGSLADIPAGVKTDSAGNLYIAGYTYSTNFPLKGAAQATPGGKTDIFVTKLDPTGTSVVYSTFLGGADYDVANALDVDAAGHVYVAGTTSSTNFPLQAPMHAEKGSNDSFVVKLAPAGNALVYGTYFGGAIYGLAAAPDGSLYVTGATLNGPNAGTLDGFVSQISPAGNAVSWNAYLAGSGFDTLSAVAVDGQGTVHVTGHSDSSQMPVDRAIASPNGYSFLIYARYAAGTRERKLLRFGNMHVGQAIATDAAGNAYIGGRSGGYDGLVNPFMSGGTLVAKILPSLDVAYATSVDGPGNGEINAIAVDATGSAYVAGTQQSIPMTMSPFQRLSGGGNDGLVARLSPAGDELMWSSPYGGAKSDELLGLALGPGGKVHVVGRTEGQLPTLGALQPTYGGGYDDAMLATITGPVSTSTRYLHGDFQDDGVADIMFSGLMWSASILHPGRLQSSWLGPATEGWEFVGTGDFNGDRRADLILRNTLTGANEIWRSGLRSRVVLAKVTDMNWQVAATGDFNGDGRWDTVWRNARRTGANDIWYSGNSASRVSLTPVANLDWIIAGAGDFDGDGKHDLLWRNLRSGANDLWRSAQASARLSLTPIPSLAWKVVAVGDFNGDRRADILWRNTSTGGNELWRSGQSSQRQVLTAVTAMAWEVKGAKDYNGDGQDDILWHHAETGEINLWLSASSARRISLYGVDWPIAP